MSLKNIRHLSLQRAQLKNVMMWACHLGPRNGRAGNVACAATKRKSEKFHKQRDSKRDRNSYKSATGRNANTIK